MQLLLTNYFATSSSLTHTATDFPLKPVFLHGVSAALHLILLLGLFVSWVRTKLDVVVRDSEGSKERFHSNWFWGSKLIFYCCVNVSVFNLVTGILKYSFWFGNRWPDGNLVSLADSMLRTLGWGAICVYLYARFFRSAEQKFPVSLRLWWGLYFCFSSCCLVTDIVMCSKHVALPTSYLVSDAVSVISGLYFCSVGFLTKSECKENLLLQESLLNGDSNVRNGEVSSLKSKKSNATPYSNVGLFSILTFSWMASLIALGNKKILDFEDVPELDSRDSIAGSFPILRNKLMEDSGKGNRVTTLKLAKSLFFTAWKDIVLTAILAILYTLANYVGPYLIDTFVQFLNGRREFKNEGPVLVSTFFVAKVIECLCFTQWIFRLKLAGIKMCSALVAMIYSKSLTLSCHAKQSYTSGELINFMTVDAERVGDFSWRLHDSWLVLLQVSLALVILYTKLGLASIVAFFATLLIMLANFPLGRLQKKFQEKLMESKDKRMKATSEILRNMQILKLQGWEMKFLSKVIAFRKVEAGWLKKFLYSGSVTSFIIRGGPIFVSVASFGACILLGIPLESGKILSALATFKILQSPINNLPETISMIIQTKVSLDRIASFLSLDNLQSDAVEKHLGSSSELAIEIVEGNFSWDVLSKKPTLKSINLTVFHGMRIAVCGTVGSGKSSLLSCILGEVPKISGTLKLYGTKAYVSQSPWIQSGNVEENILFGKQMDREKYEGLLEECSLKKDLEDFPFGDQTVIGERGINLSGGQKQRIQIARAIYQEADIYLFDDPFSAVDAHTGSHLFKEVLFGLLRTKTVIYVTHQMEFLPAADLIVVMKDGMIKQAGRYRDILSSETDFMDLLGAHQQALSALVSVEGRSGSEDVSKGQCGMNTANGVTKKERSTDFRIDKADEISVPKRQLVQDEEREKGRVGFGVYWKYIITAYGGALVPFILLAQIFSQALEIGSKYWMAWATPVSENERPVVGGFTLIIVYAALAIGSSFCIFARCTLLVAAGFETAATLFSKMHFCLFRAPMSLFDSTPSGRVLNRASTDQSTVDLSIASKVGGVAFSVIQILGVVAVLVQAGWQVLVIFIPVIAISIWSQQYYLPSARELSRLVGVCKAPVIQHFAETISGSITIRSFDQVARFEDMNMKMVDGYSQPKFYIVAAMQWLCFRLDMLSSITFAFSLVFLICLPKGVIDPAIAGLAVTYGLNLNMIQASLISKLCELENKIISVERILQYSDIPSEPPLVVESCRPDYSWPSHGEVDICGLQVRYAPYLPLVLRGLTCRFPGGMKTGIVGRTGSGKSTLIQTLFRIVEPTAGQIVIDGIDISSIGLHDLRSRLGIIPQDPTMFEGTVRNNLDPLEKYTDGEIWEALDRCQLGDEVRRKEGKLDSRVSENGENWSMGQRQLVCLGRVLLKKSKVLVLDEATASVDTATDNLIQLTLRQHFSDSTVITIAHRLTSVIDSEMVLLLSHGVIEEYDSPTKLLQNKSSSFAQLVAEYTQRSNSRE